jgi:hypothetical protein
VTRLKHLALAIGLTLALPAAAAEDPFSSHDALLCAVSSASECAPDGGCEATTPDEINFARFARVDIKNRQMKAVWPKEMNRSTPIEQLVESSGLIVMQGLDQGVAWSLTIDKPSGAFVAAATGKSVVYVLNGTCMPELPQ